LLSQLILDSNLTIRPTLQSADRWLQTWGDFDHTKLSTLTVD
jgi:hypothetical protein